MNLNNSSNRTNFASANNIASTRLQNSRDLRGNRAFAFNQNQGLTNPREAQSRSEGLGSLVRELGRMIHKLTSYIGRMLNKMAQAPKQTASQAPSENTGSQAPSGNTGSVASTESGDKTSSTTNDSSSVDSNSDVKAHDCDHGDSVKTEGTGSTDSTNDSTDSKIIETGKELVKTGEISWDIFDTANSNVKFQVTFKPRHNRKIDSVQVISADGTQVIAEGVKAGSKKDGSPRIRFTESPENFPDNVQLVVNFKGGQSRYMKVENPRDSFKY